MTPQALAKVTTRSAILAIKVAKPSKVVNDHALNAVVIMASVCQWVGQKHFNLLDKVLHLYRVREQSTSSRAHS